MKERITGLWTTLREIDYLKHVITGVFIGGVLGGLVFTVLSPIIVPPVQDAVITSGFGPKPTPQMDLQYEDELNNKSTLSDSNFSNISVNGSEHRVYYITISNPTNKVMSEVNLLYLFSGCPAKAGLFMTTLDSAVASPTSDDITIKRFYGGCGVEISIEELPPQRWATVYAIINTSKPNDQIEGHLRPNRVYMMGNYEWTYSGRTYFTSLKLKMHVKDKFTEGDRVN